MSLVSDPGLVDAERALETLTSAPLKELASQLATELFHEIIDEYLGHAHSYDRFLTPASSPVASPSSVHRQIIALRSWVARMVREAPAAEPAPFVTAQSTALGLTPAVATLLSTLLLSRLPELLAHSRSKTVTAFAPWSLKDFDWTARVTLASSALSNLRTPVLQLNLTLASPDGRLRQVPLELDRAGLDRVLEQMAKVNAVVQEYETTA